MEIGVKLMQLSLFSEEPKKMDTEEERFTIAWEFLRDSLDWLEECKYKTVTKHLIGAWEKEMKGYIKAITQSMETLSPRRNSLWVLIEFPFERRRHISIWLDNHKTRFEDLKEELKKYEAVALKEIRNA